MSAAEEFYSMDPDDQEIPDPPEPDVSLIESLSWHCNRAAWYRRKIAVRAGERDRMKASYDTWYERTTAGWARRAAESEAWIEYAVSAEVEAHPGGTKTWDLPSGTVRSVAPRLSVVVDDPEAFREWVEGRADAGVLARWTCQANKTALRTVLEDGEVVPGARLELGERRVSITLGGDV